MWWLVVVVGVVTSGYHYPWPVINHQVNNPPLCPSLVQWAPITFYYEEERRMGQNHLILLPQHLLVARGLVDNQSPGKWYSPRAHQWSPRGEIKKNICESSRHGIFPHLVAVAVVFLHCFHHTNDVGLLQYGGFLSNGGVLSRINIDSKCKLSEGWATYITLFWGIYLWGLPEHSIHTNDHYDVPYSNIPPCS